VVAGDCLPWLENESIVVSSLGQETTNTYQRSTPYRCCICPSKSSFERKEFPSYFEEFLRTAQWHVLGAKFREIPSRVCFARTKQANGNDLGWEEAFRCSTMMAFQVQYPSTSNACWNRPCAPEKKESSSRPESHVHQTCVGRNFILEMTDHVEVTWKLRGMSIEIRRMANTTIGALPGCLDHT
jgi:hypothetical protein